MQDIIIILTRKYRWYINKINSDFSSSFNRSKCIWVLVQIYKQVQINIYPYLKTNDYTLLMLIYWKSLKRLYISVYITIRGSCNHQLYFCNISASSALWQFFGLTLVFGVLADSCVWWARVLKYLFKKSLTDTNPWNTSFTVKHYW